MSIPKNDNSTYTNKADDEAAAAVAAALARGEDPFGDEDDDSVTGAAAADEPDTDDADETPEDDADEGEGDTADADDAPATQAAAEEAAEDAPDEPAPVYTTPPLAELDAQRTALRTEKEKAFADFDEGAINREQYLAIERRVDDQLDDLTGQRALLQANEQARLAAQTAKLDRIREDAKKAGTIDYADEDAAAEYNAALQFVASVKANAKLGFDALADKAHNMVLAQRGIAAPKPAAAATGKPAARTPPARPVTLAGVPAAATTGTTGTIGDKLGRLSGMEFQEAVGNLPKAQRDAYLDS